MIEIEEEEFNKLMMGGVLASQENQGATDWVKATKKGSRDTKYATWMYSKSLNKLRGRTFEEFYGNGIVD